MTDEARAHSEAGGRFFGLRRYDDAAREFQTAYALSGASELLFNLGRAYEEGARLREALDAYQRFRDAQPASFDATTLDARIADVQRRRAAQTAVATPPVTTSPATPPTVIAPPAVPPRHDPRVSLAAPPSRALPLSLMIGGGVALVGAAALGVSVVASNAALADACPDGECPTPHRDDVTSGRARALATDVVGVVGLAAVAAGVVVWLVQRPASSTQRVALGAGDSLLRVRF